MAKELTPLGILVGLSALVACAPESSPSAVAIQTPLVPATETPIPPTVFRPTVSPSPYPTATEMPTLTPTPWPTITPYARFQFYKEKFPDLSRIDMKDPETVPFVEPGDVLAQVGRLPRGAIIKKNGRMIMISQYVLDEYWRARVYHPQILTPDRTLYFEVHNYDRSDERKRSEVRRWSADRPFEGSYIPAATCDTGPHCSFRHPPAIDSLGLYGVVIQDDIYLRLFEVSPHHEGILWKAPPNWMIKEAVWGIGETEDDLYLVMEHFRDRFNPHTTVDKVGVFRLRDAAEHQHFPSGIIQGCENKCPNSATHKMMEYNQMDLRRETWPLRKPGMQPKLETLFEGGDREGFYLYNLWPVWHPFPEAGKDGVIYPVKEP